MELSGVITKRGTLIRGNKGAYDVIERVGRFVRVKNRTTGEISRMHWQDLIMVIFNHISCPILDLFKECG